MNSQTAVERAYRLIVPAPDERMAVNWRTTLNVLINDARLEFADQIASSPNFALRNLLRRQFAPVDCVAGSANLNVPLQASEPLLLKHLATADIRLSDGGVTRKVTLLPDESTLDLDRPLGFAFAALHGNILKVRSNNQPYDGDVVITSQVMPTLANITGQLEEPYVVVLHSLAAQKVPSKPRIQAKETQAVAAEAK